MEHHSEVFSTIQGRTRVGRAAGRLALERSRSTPTAALLVLGTACVLTLGACSPPSENAATPDPSPVLASPDGSLSSQSSPSAQPAPNGFEALRQQSSNALGQGSAGEAPEPTPGQQAVPPTPEAPPAPVNDGSALRQEIINQNPGEQATGFPVTVEGRTATMCTMGNGYGIGFVMSGNGQTSCEFANAVGAALIHQAADPSTDMRGILPATVTATSPATNEAYDMSCATQARGLIVCNGGNAAEVLIV